MKRTIILSLSALTLFSCGGNQPQQTQSQPQNTAETAAETSGEKTFKYVEPQDSVVKTIWEKLKKEDKHISNVITDAVNFDYIPQSEAEIFKSKTAMEYDYLVPMPTDGQAVRRMPTADKALSNSARPATPATSSALHSTFKAQPL